MNFMNNKRQIYTSAFLNAGISYVESMDKFSGNTVANMIGDGTYKTNKDEFIDKVIKKFFIFPLNDNEIIIFDENSNKIDFNDKKNYLRYNEYYSFTYIGQYNLIGEKFYLNNPVFLDFVNNSNFLYDFALFKNKIPIENGIPITYDENILIDNVNEIGGYINKKNNSTNIKLYDSISFVISMKEKLTNNKYNLSTIFFNETINNTKIPIRFTNEDTFNLINKSNNITINDKLNSDIHFFNNNYIVSNLSKNVSFKLNNNENLKKEIYHFKTNELIIDSKDEYVIEPNDLFIFNIKENVQRLSPIEIKNLNIDNMKKIPNLINNTSSNLKIIPFYSLQNKTFQEFNTSTNSMQIWHLLDNDKSYNDKKEFANSIMNDYQKYYKYIINVRLVFNNDIINNNISFYSFNKDGILELTEKSNELSGIYLLLFPFYDTIDEDNMFNYKISLNNDYNINMISEVQYNLNNSLTGDILISKIRIQTNDNEHIIMNKPSWIIKKIFIWSNNDNILRNNNNISIKGTGGLSVENTQAELDKAESDLKNAKADLVKETNSLKKDVIQTLIQNLTDTIQYLTNKLKQIIYHQYDIVNDYNHINNKSYVSGNNREVYTESNKLYSPSFLEIQYEVLDNEKQYLEIKLEKPILYNNIQHIFVESGLNLVDFLKVQSNSINNNNNNNIYTNGNINTTSLLFYDPNNNEIKDCAIDFSKVELKDSVNNVENVDNIYLLKGPAYDSYSENVYESEYENKPNTFATNYLTSEKIVKLENANNINMKLVD